MSDLFFPLVDPNMRPNRILTIGHRHTVRSFLPDSWLRVILWWSGKRICPKAKKECIFHRFTIFSIGAGFTYSFVYCSVRRALDWMLVVLPSLPRCAQCKCGCLVRSLNKQIKKCCVNADLGIVTFLQAAFLWLRSLSGKCQIRSQDIRPVCAEITNLWTTRWKREKNRASSKSTIEHTDLRTNSNYLKTSESSTYDRQTLIVVCTVES